MAATGLFTKLIAGHPARKTRLHSQQGKLVGASQLLRNGPRAVVTAIGRLAFDYRPVRPWISYDGQAAIAERLDPKRSRVLEFGSGMSTAWYAARSLEIVAIEDYRPWFDKVGAIMAKRGISNVRYRFAADAGEYIGLAREEAGAGYDLVMIDGSHRHLCAELAVEVIRPGGMIYLDNVDKGTETTITGDLTAAANTLLSFAKARGAEVRWFTDFAPTQLFVQTALLIIVPE